MARRVLVVTGTRPRGLMTDEMQWSSATLGDWYRWARPLYRFDVDDIGMRNLAIVALTDAGRRVDVVAGLLGLTAS